MISQKFIASLVIAVFIALLSETDANAWFRFRNKTNTTIWVAFQRYSPHCDENSEWAVAGWWKLTPGQTKTVFGADLQTVNKYYYYYAEGADGSVWSGPFDTCTPITAFDWCDNVCNTAPETRILGYREKYIGNFNNYTINLINRPLFTCAHCNDGSCQCGNQTGPQLCANHGGDDPSIGCQQQQ